MPPSKTLIRETLFNEYNYVTDQDVDGALELTKRFEAGEVRPFVSLTSFPSTSAWFAYTPTPTELHIILVWNPPEKDYHVYRFFQNRPYYFVSKRKRWKSSSKKLPLSVDPNWSLQPFSEEEAGL